MKNLIIIISLAIFSTNFTIYCSAQAVSSNLAYESQSSSKKTNADLPANLAAIITQSSDNKFSIGVHVENYVEGKFSIKLKSSTGLLHKEIVENKTYVRKYDMYNLPVGDYKIEVENDKEVYVKKITIRNNNGVRVLSIM